MIEVRGNFIHNFEAVAHVLRINNVLKLNRGAEVGVRRGEFSAALLDQFSELEMRLIDPYMPYQDLDVFYTEEMQAKEMMGAFSRVAKFSPRFCWYFEPSAVAQKHVPEGVLDFVFIDAEHTNSAVREDLGAWLPKIRPGGVLCGHDYAIAAVRSAVDTFASARRLTVQTIALPADVWFMEV